MTVTSITATLTALPAAPVSNQPGTYTSRMDAYAPALVTLRTEMSSVITQINTTVGDMNVLGDDLLETSSQLTMRQSGRFEADGLLLFDYINTAASDTTYSVNADGEIVVTGGSTEDARRAFFAGHYRPEGFAMWAEVTMTVPAETPPTVHPTILIGDGADRRYYVWTSGGDVFVRDTNYNDINPAEAMADLRGYNDDGSRENVEYGSGETITLRVISRTDNTGWLEAETSTVKLQIPLVDIPSGPIYAAFRDVKTGGGSAFTLKSLKVQASPQNIQFYSVNPVDAGDSASVQNLLPHDWLDGDLRIGSDLDTEWTTGNADDGSDAGSVTAVEANGFAAAQIAGSRSLRTQLNVRGGDTIAIHFLMHSWDFNTGGLAPSFSSDVGDKFQVVQYNSGGSEIRRDEWGFAAVRPGGVLSETLTLDAAADKIFVRITCNSNSTVVVSHPCIAVSSRAGFRPTVEPSYGRTARLDTFTVLPDSTASRDPSGFTSTGLCEITSGDYAGCWAIADDGRLVEGDSSSFDPNIHIVTRDGGKILLTIEGTWSHSAQGVCFDPDTETLWLACSGDQTIRNFNLYGGSAGTEITGNQIDITAAPLSMTGNANALAWVPSEGASGGLLVGTTAGGTVKLYDVGAGTVSATYTFDETPDHFYLTEDEASVLYSYTTNGVDAIIRTFRLSDSSETVFATLPRCQAVEGLHLDEAANVLTVANDGGFHTSANPALNILMRYRVPGLL